MSGPDYSTGAPGVRNPSDGASSGLAAPDLQADAPLVALWRQLGEVTAHLTTLETRRDVVAQSLPAWVRAEGQSYPEWTDEMLLEHAIPPELGRRFGPVEIHALNETLERSCPMRVELEKEAGERRVAAFKARIAEADQERERIGLTGIDSEIEAVVEDQVSLIREIVRAKHATAAGLLVRAWTWLLSHSDFGRMSREEVIASDDGAAVLLDVIGDLHRQYPATVAALQPLPVIVKIIGGAA
ncbi:hypothetical protein [Azospirillum rugosum]|uniref:Uncharacterized protein n=1 Tax=Azospirillum rugosum TaxID=416170 RepID=A0ABS4SEM0_9PROT|nr:hypothetical protein [Azospirillum rugosum]MBP2291014.1 hypothetical protein [Azospirillum rugosum]MDQ0524922.1 hypothetical protein [Azospirillum rugosum]